MILIYTIIALFIYGVFYVSLVLMESIQQERSLQIKQERENEKIEIIKNSIVVEKAFYGLLGLHIELKNISDKNIIGVKLNTTFTNNFGETLCPNPILEDNIDSTKKRYIQSTQNLIKSGESYTFPNERITFYVGDGNVFSCYDIGDRVDNTNEIKIKNIEIYTVVFEDGEKIVID